jgi:hypothetical protein
MNYRDIISEIVEDNTAPALTLSLRDIIDEIKKRTGSQPSTNTISYILGEMGYKTRDKGKHVWVKEA